MKWYLCPIGQLRIYNAFDITSYGFYNDRMLYCKGSKYSHYSTGVILGHFRTFYNYLVLNLTGLLFKSMLL